MKQMILDLLNNTKLIPMLVGKTGEGKTAFVETLASDLNKDLITLNLSAIESSDLTGIPYISNNSMLFSRPKFLDYDIIFLDEIDRVRDSSVKSALLSLFQSRAINGHALKKDTKIICAGNGLSEDYDTAEFDAALERRIARIEFKYTANEKIKFFQSQGLVGTLLDFFITKQELLNEIPSARLHAALQVQHNNDALKVILNKDIFRAYESFLNSGLVSLKNIANNDYNFLNLSAISRQFLISDIVSKISILDSEFSEPQLKNINEFLNELTAEEKSVYFSGIKKALINESISGKEIKELDKKGFFKGQKLFLKELL